ncbi:hypothetical protein ASD80_05085 [Devosia sp. Root635]|nr:hypothetical protein ASD80_05085 [Devosia sp. Root635]
MGAFFQKRFARIIPLLWVAILAYAALKLLGRGDFDPLPMLRALTLFPIGELEPNVVWTLRHEALFYTLFAVTFLGSRRRAWIIVAWIVAPIVAWPLVGEVGRGNEAWGMSLVNFITHPVNILFGMGLALGLFWNFRPSGQIKLQGGVLFAILLGGFAILTLAVYFWQLSFNSVPGVLVTGSISVILMFCSIKSKIEVGTVSRVGMLLGSASYSIYLFHLHFVSAILGIWASLFPESPMWIVILMTSLAAVLLCIAVHLVVEKPLVAMAQHTLARRAKPA